MRDNARDHVERYLARGGRWHGWLYETQLTGQRVIQIWQRTELSLPAVGAVLCLVQDRDKPTEYEQYVRIDRTEDEIRTFTHAQAGSYKRRIVTLHLSDALRATFNGASVTPYDADADAQSKSVVLETVVANAAKYYGVSKLAEAASLGAMRVRVGSVFSQLVPSARQEVAIPDANPSGAVTTLVASGNGDVTFTTANSFSPASPIYIGSPFMPGSLSITVGSTVLLDVAGELKSGSVSVGAVDAARGLIQIAPTGPTYTGTKTVKFTPAGAPSRVMNTAAIDVTLESRGFTYVETLSPAPAPGSLVVSFMAQGKWYDLRDKGNGELAGADASFGSGTINYATGTAVITCGAMPDVDSSILFFWGTPVTSINRSALTVKAPALKGQLQYGGIAPNTITVTWPDGVATRTAHDDGAGNFTGDATGTIRYQTGEYELRPNTAPMGGAQFQFNYQWGSPASQAFNSPARDGSGFLNLALQDANILAGSIEVIFEASPDMTAKELAGTTTGPVQLRAVDNGTGGLIGLKDSASVNTVNYTAGTLHFKPVATAQVQVAQYDTKWDTLQYVPGSGPQKSEYLSGYTTQTRDVALPLSGGTVTVRYRTSNSAQAVQETVTLSALTFDLTDRYAEKLVAGAVRFRYAGRTYLDVNGRLVTDLNTATGAATDAGTLDYQSGLATLTLWTSGQANAIAVESLLTEIGGLPVSQLVFRIPVAPVRPGSLSLSASTLNGVQVRVDADADSYFGNSHMQGRVDYATGVVVLRFGAMVTAAGNESEPWYDPTAVVDGQIWKPESVLAETIRYNAVGYQYLPLDANILGLDTVRLPADGRVPIFQTSDVVVVHHTRKDALPNPVSAGVTYSAGRTRLSRLRIVDSLGMAMPEERYTRDLDAGTVVLNSPLDLSGLAAPLYLEHRIEDSALAYDVQISGWLSLTRALSHDFPANETLVSSALVIGNMRARATNVFSMQTWGNTWSNTSTSAATTSQYNVTQYPVVCVNDGTLQERWALIFTSTTDFRVVGEYSGQIAVGNVNTDLAPVNPNTGKPYFTVKAAGWGSGWSAGNVLRFNTIGANQPVWLARSVLMGNATLESDAFQIQIRGDADNS